MNDELIPIIIDSIKWMNDFENTRCMYYRIEFEDSLFQVSGGSEEDRSSAKYVMGSWEILSHPFRFGVQDSNMHFSDPDLIEDTFHEIEKTDQLTLEFGHIWIPNKTLGTAIDLNSLRDGDVLRITRKLFSACFRYSADLIEEPAWISIMSQMGEKIEFSEEESKAFRKWRANQINKSIQRYRNEDYKGFRLNKKLKRK